MLGIDPLHLMEYQNALGIDLQYSNQSDRAAIIKLD